MLYHMVFLQVNIIKENKDQVHILAILSCSINDTYVYCSTYILMSS